MRWKNSHLVEAYQEGQNLTVNELLVQPHYGNQTAGSAEQIGCVDNALADLELQSTQDIKKMWKKSKSWNSKTIGIFWFGGEGALERATSGNPWEFEVLVEMTMTHLRLFAVDETVKAQINEMQMPE